MPALATATILLCAASVRTAGADVVTDWNDAALNAIRSSQTPPPRAARALAMLHVSIFDAINGFERDFEPYFVKERPRGDGSQEAAATAAAHQVLTSLFQASAASFDAVRESSLAAIKDGPRKQRGVEWGERVAAQILAWRAGDNSDAIVAPPAGAGAGAWIPTPPAFVAYLLPHWGEVTPFAMPSNAHFRPLGPPPLASAEYAGELNQVKALGAAKGSSRTPDQQQIALFWADGVGTETPAGHWNSIAQDVAAARGNTVIQNARLFALINVAMADAAICSWEAKYAFNFWRPVTAIRNADTDGNDATASDPTWSSLIVTPPFPDYVSGHSTYSGAAASVLARFYGTDAIAFATGSDFLPGVSRRFSSFSAAASEAADSRLYGGIHFRSASEDGLAAGKEIGAWTVENYLRPLKGRNHVSKARRE
jgi:PAP2 superfamily